MEISVANHKAKIQGPALESRLWRVGGCVQGVGFRPFVYRLAQLHGLQGWVQNCLGQVEICTQGNSIAQDTFRRELLEQAPPLAEPVLIAVDPQPLGDYEGFSIRPSREHGDIQIHLPPDYFTCPDCLRELSDPHDRRFLYPFINCTQCGPRYTLIQALPYDRRNTSMASFALCPTCEAEYSDPSNRRFHAEPVACPDCGPQVEFVRPGLCRMQATLAVSACVDALRAGDIVAVKGIGGYHLMCDAGNDLAIIRLRKTKPRPDKPLAVMFPTSHVAPLNHVLQAVILNPVEREALLSPVRPIVLAERRRDSRLSNLVAPGLREIGVMLPYSPLHHILVNEFGGPLLATSGNLGGEPVITGNREAEQRLQTIAAGFLHHNRDIVRPADDPVLRRLAGKPRPIRLGRGNAPLEINLSFELPKTVIAVGGHMKNAVTLAWGNRAVISPHIGDMGSVRSMDMFKRLINDLQTLYGVKADRLVCDAHPGYGTSRWAQGAGLPVTKVYHHHAHASALVAEHEPDDNWLVFAWDGVGYGEDGTLWGGEALAGSPGNWQRVASMRPFRLPGGDKAGREPWRSAAAVCWEIGRNWEFTEQNHDISNLLYPAWKRGINAPQTSAVGRLFDAAAALCGVCTSASYEGQGPMQLEALCQGGGVPIELPLHQDDSGFLVSDWQPLIESLLENTACDAVEAADRVHASLAEMLVAQAIALNRQRAVGSIGLCGGVFQNRVLTERVVSRLQEEGFRVFLNDRIPTNDAGLSFGQIVEYGFMTTDNSTN